MNVRPPASGAIRLCRSPGRQALDRGGVSRPGAGGAQWRCRCRSRSRKHGASSIARGSPPIGAVALRRQQPAAPAGDLVGSEEIADNAGRDAHAPAHQSHPRDARDRRRRGNHCCGVGVRVYMTSSHPNVVVLGGPNGAGKSTAAPRDAGPSLAVVRCLSAVGTNTGGIRRRRPANKGAAPARVGGVRRRIRS